MLITRVDMHVHVCGYSQGRHCRNRELQNAGAGGWGLGVGLTAERTAATEPAAYVIWHPAAAICRPRVVEHNEARRRNMQCIVMYTKSCVVVCVGKI